MKRSTVWASIMILSVSTNGFCAAPDAAGPACPPASGVALQILGSGGPVADDGRASSAYLVWLDGRARVLVDAGGGSFLRFGEAGARFGDLELVALSHYHTDHAADLPAILKSGYFSDRTRALAISGPASGGPFPGLDTFLNGLLDAERGAFAYLSGYLDGTDGLVRLERTGIDHRAGEATQVLDSNGLKVTAIGVPHGIVPALAYRVEAAGRSLVFGSDQTGEAEPFSRFAAGADVLVATMAIPEAAGRGARSLHATPSAIGKMAQRTGTGKLVLSHFMARSLANLADNVREVEKSYGGEVVTATDLACLIP